ncbi:MULTISPECIES: spore coat U domain-containing protein [Tatumella]|uniref:Spore coat U domain-containing protein n=1 Tax=Tatumella punctata TaxID=399969 RepID=A0ABW1VQG0_9GAMM|nr:MULTISPECIES: spore coat U domain-containing protein [unclassified Tatumella]MBS0854712.1 spore coat protein U domain-containing protein [Tatumella sp. JGM16]MBS0875983.1 spore coat protein U domain-containing protein [Tatumella sp. JGM82]MBS0890388.1 spore coat protein U domain-containing protein [Tatumella sp. JGM94]MBS0892506.1 spore coat protein U domain-containing protein [Tatumella sp. JGM130]MBS0900514.1 spore coat protein U domain-containing protein [Tatumella sp. JGM100]
MLKKSLVLSSLSSALLFSVMAHADTSSATANMNVKLTVQKACTISMGDLDFGTQNSNAGDVSRTATGSVTCTKDTAYNITAASNSGYNLSDTKGDKVSYAIYADANHQTNLSASVASTSGTGTGIAQPVNIYGVINGTSLQTAPVGDYTDKVTLTVNY